VCEQAVQQGQLAVVHKLLLLYPDVDVLAKNSFGKSICTEAFARGDVAILEAVLKHDSARQLETDGGAHADEAIDAEVTHSFLFAPALEAVALREVAGVAASDSPEVVLGASASEDKTGLQLWAAALVLSHWLLDARAELASRSVIELGAGCGLCGIVAAKLCGAKDVLLTDLAEHTICNMHHNVEINGLSAGGCRVSVLDWDDPSTWPPPAEVLIGSDLVYAAEAVPQLLRVVSTLMQTSGSFFYVAPETNRQGEAEFLEGLVAAGFAREAHEVPQSYLMNVLADRTDEEFRILFSELSQRTYTLFRFSRGAPVTAT